MTTSLQSGILAFGTRAHHYLEFDLIDGAANADASAAAISAASSGLTEARAATAGANIVVGFRSSVWASSGATTGAPPAGLGDFETLTGPDGFSMPSGQHDVWVWVSAAGPDDALDAARAVAAALAPCARLAAEQSAFTYHDSRDLSGFIDGTENPPVVESPGIITVPDTGGTIVFVQRWVHDLAALHAHPLHEQERIIGRTKADSVELDDDARPESAHISRVAIEDDGEELEVVRRSTPFGGVAENGLVFVAFTRDRDRIDRMLRRMVGLDGPRDALTAWSTPISAAYYYVPPAEALIG